MSSVTCRRDPTDPDWAYGYDAWQEALSATDDLPTKKQAVVR
jgi:hypothetical protein